MSYYEDTGKLMLTPGSTIYISQIMDSGYIHPKAKGSDNEIKTHCKTK
jgi:hypothetical protein